MTQQYILDSSRTKNLPRWLPYAIGASFVALFAFLCLWQIGRGLEKQEQMRLYTRDSSHVSWSAGMEIVPFQRLKVSGRFDSRHQFLLENIVLNARQGYFVITPLRLDRDDAVLLVNRGWVPKPETARSTEFMTVREERVTVRGRAGHLPRAGFKMGAGIAAGQRWPKFAVFPDYEEVTQALERDVHSMVLLLDPEEDDGFVREWQPREFGPGRHFGYAFQWFVMAAVLGGLLIRNYRRGGASS